MNLRGGAGISQAKWKCVFHKEGLAFPKASRKKRECCMHASMCYAALLEMQEDEIKEAARRL